ncbi:MAG TPA: proline--tRNA ligase [Acidimicrobiales bacterium]|nr:proline--tRNA ligase [Acidimicrobiales bacterium]
MRISRLLLRTLRDAPGDAEVASHRLLVRAGYIRRVASGIYTYLPLGQRVLMRITQIVRDEMNRAGAQEILMPVLQPRELWEQSGRVDSLGPEVYSAFETECRGARFVLGPTHEEVVTATVSADVDSYRDLPLTVYQIQSKFRGEARPRYGLLRGREFVMKDAYSFDVSAEAMKVSYQAQYDAYCAVFDRCGLPYIPVEAQAGAIGGDVNHEFMVPSEIGEDHFARCTSCDYSANVEAAQSAPRQGGPAASSEALVSHHTPERPGIDLVVEFFADRALKAEGMLKCIAVLDGEDRAALILVPGDREAIIPAGMRPFADGDFASHPDLMKGYIGPMGMQQRGVRVLADHAIAVGGPWVTGANELDHHVTGATLERDFQVDEWGPFATVAAGDPCPRCGEALELVRSVEAGHVFQLGLRYSTTMQGATFTDEKGEEKPFWMGCYGIGISRLMAVIAEANHDDAGLTWPSQVAPFDVHLLSLGAERSPEVAAAADQLYTELSSAGVEVLYDDRDASAGVKFADADLIGLPTQLVVGKKGLERGVVERKDRATGERDEVPLEKAAAMLGARK